MKIVLTGDDAILEYQVIQGSYSSENVPRACGYFNVDDADFETGYDRGTILAFDSTNGGPYEEVFGSVDAALEWINP